MAAKTNANPFQIRGLMLDSARLMERYDFYFDLLPRLASWGINTLWWHFADDQGFRLKLRSHPEVCSALALSRAQTLDFIHKAKQLGIDVVPEVESLGHARYITKLPQYAHLADGKVGIFNAICPSQKQTLSILRDIIEEVAGLFESPYFHAGLDEVNFSGCPRCQRRSKGTRPWWLFVQHTLAIHRIVTGCGKQMVMWADHVEKAPEMLKALPKDIILTHWQYRDVHAERIERSLKAGFRVIGAPAMCHAGDMVYPTTQNFQNMDDMTGHCARLARRGGVLGVVNTWWTAWRGLRDAYLPAAGYTGRLLGLAKPVADKTAYLRTYLKAECGLNSASAAKALWKSYGLSLPLKSVTALLTHSPVSMYDAVSLAEQEGFAARAAEMEQVAVDLAAAGKAIKSRRAEFDAIVLGANVMRACYRNGTAMKQVMDLLRIADYKALRMPQDEARQLMAQVRELIKARSAEVNKLCKQVEREWNRTRFSSDETKGTRIEQSGFARRDGLLGRLTRCRLFLNALASDVSVLSPAFMKR